MTQTMYRLYDRDNKNYSPDLYTYGDALAEADKMAQQGYRIRIVRDTPEISEGFLDLGMQG